MIKDKNQRKVERTTRTSKIKVLNAEKRKSVTGAKRQNDSGKGLPILCSPIVDTMLAQHMQGGVEAGYDARNWELGLPLGDILNSVERHLKAIKEGRTDENHVLAVYWNMHIFIHTKEMIRRGILPKELDDLVSYIPITCPTHGEVSVKPKIDCDICTMVWENRKLHVS